VSKCKALGGRVIQHGDDIGEAKAYADEIYVKGEGLRYVNGFDHPHIISGQVRGTSDGTAVD
jgi:threonine dehydratase